MFRSPHAAAFLRERAPHTKPMRDAAQGFAPRADTIGKNLADLHLDDCPVGKDVV